MDYPSQTDNLSLLPWKRPLISLGSNHAVFKIEFACSVKVYMTRNFFHCVWSFNMCSWQSWSSKMCPSKRPLISLGSNHAVFITEFACSVKVYDTKFFSLFQVLQYGYLIFLKFKNVSSKKFFRFWPWRNCIFPCTNVRETGNKLRSKPSWRHHMTSVYLLTFYRVTHVMPNHCIYRFFGLFWMVT